MRLLCACLISVYIFITPTAVYHFYINFVARTISQRNLINFTAIRLHDNLYYVCYVNDIKSNYKQKL